MRIAHESFALKERHKTPRSQFWFSRVTEKFTEWWRPSPHTMQWSHRETHSLIKILARLGVGGQSHIRTGLSATWAATVVLDCRRQNPRHVRWAETTLGWLLEEISSQAAHGPTTQVTTSDFYPWQIQPKMGNRMSQKQKGVSESQPLTNTPARFMYRAHTCKYLVNWRNYTKRDLSLKGPNLGSFYILKLIFLCTQLEKASRALVSRSF